MSRAKVIAVAPIVLTLLLAACGSSGSSSSPSAASSTSSAATSGSSGGYGSPSSSASAPASGAVMITTKQAKLGTILAVGPKQLTVYLFEADKGSSSSCNAACASAWPPVTGKPQAAGGALASDLGTITRPDGSTQVTYKGHPLYTFVKDKDNGDAYGQGVNAFGAGWYVLTPSGNKIDKS